MYYEYAITDIYQKNSKLNVKKGCTRVKKDVKSKVAAKKWL